MESRDGIPPLGGADDGGDQRRIDTILTKVRRETSMRDVLIFSMAKAWSVLLIFGSVMYVVADSRGSTPGEDGAEPSA